MVHIGGDMSDLARDAVRARSVSSGIAALHPEVQIGGNVRPLEGAATRARSLAAQIARLAPTVTVDTEDRATARLLKIQGIARELGIIDPEVTVTAEIVRADARLRYIDRVLDSIDGRHAVAHVDVDERSVGAFGRLGQAVRRTTGDIKDFNERMRFLENVSGIALRSGIVGVAGAVAGLGASAGVAAGALAGVVTGLGLVGLAAKQTFDKIEYKEGQFVAKKGGTLTASQNMLVGVLNQFAGAYTRALAPANSAVNVLMADVLRFAQQALPALGVAAVANVGALSRAFATLKASLSLPAQATIFKEFLAGLPGVLQPAAEIAGRLALATFNIFSVPIRSGLAAQFLNYVNQIVGRFLAWTSSSAGQQAILQFFRDGVPAAQALAWAVTQVWNGFVQIWQSGVLQSLAVNVATLLGIVGQSLPNLTMFLWAMNGLLVAFNSLPAPIQNAVITFAALNFVLGGIPLMLLGGLVSGIVSLVKWSLILRALNAPGLFSMLGSAIGGMARTAGFWLEWFGTITLPNFVRAVGTFIAARLPAAILAGSAGVTAALAVIAGSFYYIFGPAGAIIGVLIGVAAFIAGGWVVLVVAAVVAAFAAIAVAIYRNWEPIKAALYSFRAWFQSLPAMLQNALAQGIAQTGILGSLIASFVSGRDYITNTSGLPLISWFGSLPGWLQNALTRGLSGVNIFAGIVSAVANFADWLTSNDGGGMVAWFENLPGYLANGIIQGLRNTPLFGPIIDTISNFFDWLTGGNLLSSLESLGASILSGLARGAWSKAKEVYHAIVDPIVNAYNAVRNWLQSRSPSKRFERLGFTAPEGYAKGAFAGIPLVQKVTRAFTGAMSRGIEAPSIPAPASGATSGSVLPPAVSASLERRERNKRGRRREMATINVHLDGNLIKSYIEEVVYENTRSGIVGGAL